VCFVTRRDNLPFLSLLVCFYLDKDRAFLERLVKTPILIPTKPPPPLTFRKETLEPESSDGELASGMEKNATNLLSKNLVWF